MQYQDALREWGARRLEDADQDHNARLVLIGCAGERQPGLVVDRATVTVTFEFDAGYPCCAGTDEDCYCSMAQSPRADVLIKGEQAGVGGPVRMTTIPMDDFDFARVLGELVAAADGVVTGY